MSPNLKSVLADIRPRLDALYGSRLKGVYLYGSQACGNARPDSDVDIMVVLEGEFDYWNEVKQCIHALYPLELASGYPLSVKIANAADYRAETSFLLREVNRDGIAV